VCGIATYGNINSDGYPYPGSTNKTLFSDNTTPSAKSWSGIDSDFFIDNILETDSIISFEYTTNTFGSNIEYSR